MKTVSRQVSRSHSQEATGRANRIKASLNLALSPDFDRDYGPYGPDGEPAGFFTYTHLGYESYEIRLRFSQVSHEWAVSCPHFNIETSFPHQPAPVIKQLLNDWLQGYIQPISVADEIIFERRF